MFDIWIGDVELTTLVLIFSIVVLLPIQLLLCFKVKNRVIRLLPVLVLSILTMIFIAMSVVITGWDALGYIFLAIFAGMMLLMCGIGWGIWSMIRFNKEKKNLSIMISILVFSMAIIFTDAVIKPNYFVKIPIKIVFFLALPLLFFAKNKEDFSEFKKLFIFKKSGILKALLLGIGVYTVILLGYFITRNIIDYSNVTYSLTAGMGITADNFLYVSLYISLMNSFLEEFFFRGYGFITLKKYTTRKVAYLFSSTLFALYHVGMLIGMFHFGVLLLLLMGLIIGGCIFNYLNELNDNIYPSWFVHMFANFAINTIGFILFGVL